MTESQLREAYPAFFKWFHRSFHADLAGGKGYLQGCVFADCKDAPVWDLLLLVDDGRGYNAETLMKAAELAVALGAE